MEQEAYKQQWQKEAQQRRGRHQQQQQQQDKNCIRLSSSGLTGPKSSEGDAKPKNEYDVWYILDTSTPTICTCDVYVLVFKVIMVPAIYMVR